MEEEEEESGRTMPLPYRAMGSVRVCFRLFSHAFECSNHDLTREEEGGGEEEEEEDPIR